MPTATLEEYLESIYKLAQSGPVKPTALAEAIGVSGPTVTATLRRLESHELITRDGTAVVLTGEGMARAIDIVRRHRIAERFLVDVLGLDWDAAHEDACLLEHALSPRVLLALERFLENPEVCPHGHPIPSADGSVAAVTGEALSSALIGVPLRVLRVSEDNEEVLGYIGALGLRPGVTVVVIERAPFDGPLTIRVGDNQSAVACEIARLVMVEAIS